MSRVLNPAERGMTAVKNAASTLPGSSSRPSVPGLLHSVARKTRVPSSSRARLVPTVILVSTDHLRGWRQAWASSNTTGKPSPPTMQANAIVRQIQGSDTNRTRLSGQRAKPALLNAVTAWKAPR